MIDKARELIIKSCKRQDFDHLALCYFDLSNKNSQSLEFHNGLEGSIENFYFDLASMTKVLGMGLLRVKRPQLFKGDKELLLEHRGGLPRWAILGKTSWQETVKRFEIKASDTEYSDLSMLRLMLTLEEEEDRSFYELVKDQFSKEVCFWKDLPENATCPDTGIRKGNIINGVVNDDNCFKINRFCSHAGLFGTIEGVREMLFRAQQEYQLTGIMQDAFKEGRTNRFLYGWDTVSDPSKSLAGKNAPSQTFGHLGFTGTSVWIDAQSGKGWILLTNATRKYWYNRSEINALRISLGQLLWNK